MHDVDELISGMADTLRARLAERGAPRPLLVGVHTGGVWVAERLRQRLGLTEELGALDPAFYRDDYAQRGVAPQVRPSSLPHDVDGRHVVLVDDVLHTGRTVRAALNEIFDYGRPASVTLAALVDRGGRQLPIAADVVGLRLDLAPGDSVKLSGPAPLQLVIQQQP